MVGVSLAILLSTASMDAQPPARTPSHPSVEKARGLNSEEMSDYLRELGSKKKFKDLMAILKADLRYSFMAGGVLAEELEPEKAIAFCASLELRSNEWMSAISHLRAHPKEKVIGYIKQVATSEIREVRAVCYWVCGSKGWADLVRLAKHDLKDDRPVLLPSQTEHRTLAMEAKRYLDLVSPRNPK